MPLSRNVFERPHVPWDEFVKLSPPTPESLIYNWPFKEFPLTGLAMTPGAEGKAPGSILSVSGEICYDPGGLGFSDTAEPTVCLTDKEFLGPTFVLDVPSEMAQRMAKMGRYTIELGGEMCGQPYDSLRPFRPLAFFGVEQPKLPDAIRGIVSGRVVRMANYNLDSGYVDEMYLQTPSAGADVLMAIRGNSCAPIMECEVGDLVNLRVTYDYSTETFVRDSEISNISNR